jgi:WD40 repeat protein/DNA-binding SARP family transcriptional activator
MRVCILGPLELWEEGKELRLGGGRKRALLLLLVLHANEVVSADRLIDALWSGTPPATAGKVVQTWISQLRKVLPEGALVTHRSGYVLRVAESDQSEFERLVREAQAQDPAGAAMTLRTALGLWRGRPYAEVEYEPWAQAEIRRLEDLRVATLEDRIDADLQLGRHAVLVSELEALVDEQPLRERVRGSLILALYRSGRQADALAAYADARRRLSGEFGIEPGRELRELQQAILRQDAALDLPDGVQAPGSDARAPARAGGVKAFLIANDRGCAAFTRRRGDEAAASLAVKFGELARTGVEKAGGSLVELGGDEALAVFDSPRQAIRAAVELQLAFVDETIADPLLPLAVGIGLDAGEAVRVDGGYRGGALNLAGRLAAVAGPAEILMSREVAHLAGKLDGIRFGERGSFRLDGLLDTVDVIDVRPELEDLAQDIAFRRALGPVAGVLAEGSGMRNPYKGLRAFEEADAADFFGRDLLTEHLVERFRKARLLAVVGPSGSGKSSLVRAGLIPKLRAGALPGSETWRIVEMFPGAHPLEELEAALLRVDGNSHISLIEQLEDGERGLLRAIERILPPGDSELVLVLDQLEEAFTLVADEGRRAHFLTIIDRAVSDSRSRLRVVTTLRADFYDRPLLYSGFAELLRDHVEALVPLRPDEFERAIVGPAERVGVRLEPGLLAEMIADVAAESGSLPLLQYALTELYERREGNVLTRAVYLAMGGVSGALASRADEMYAGLSDPAQDAARHLLLRLVTPGEGTEDTRRRVGRDEIASIEVDQRAMAETIDVLGSSRLLSFDRDPRTGTPTIEVAHESLLRKWARLQRWIDGAREDIRMHRRLATAASEWVESERDRSFLLRGSHLAQFESWREESRLALTGLEREFVDASSAEGRRESMRQQHENRRLKTLLAGVGVLLGLAVVAGVVAFLQRQSARHEATVALSRQLGAAALIEPRIDRAMLLAHEAVNLNRSTETEGTLLATLLRSPAALATFSFPIKARPMALSLSPDGRTLVVSDSQNEIRVFDTRTHRESRPPLRNIGIGFAVPYSPDGSLLAALKPVGEPPGLALLDARTLKVVRVLPFDPRFTLNTTPLAPFEIAPDDATVFLTFAVLNPDRSDGPAYLDLWNVATSRRTSIRLGSNGILGAEYVTAGKRIVTITDTQITTWDARTLRRLHTIRQPVSRDAVVADVSPDGRTVAVGTSFGSVTFVDVATGRVTPGTAAHSGAVEQLVFSPDGRVMVSAGTDATVIVWDTATAQPIRTLAGHGSQVTGAAFSRDGRTLFTASPDGVIFEWDLGTQRRFGQPFTTTSGPPRLAIDAQLSPPPLAISRDGSDFAVRGGASSVAIYSTQSLRRLHRFAVQAGGDVIGLAWSSTGELAVTGDRGRVQLWDVRGRPRLVRALHGLRSINGQREAVTTTAFSPDGRSLAAADVNHTPVAVPYQLGTIAVWSTSGKRQWMTTGHGRISTVAFSPDGKTIAACRDNGSVLLYDARTGHLERTLHPEGTSDLLFTTAAYARDGKILATGTAAGIVQLWNPATGAQIGHPTLVAAAPVASIDFDPTGERFATTGASDGLAKLWTTGTQQQFGATFPGDPGQWGEAQYTPDGSKLIVVYQDGTGFVWPVSLPDWEAQACTVAGRNLTREEWSRFIGNRRYAAVCPSASLAPATAR